MSRGRGEGRGRGNSVRSILQYLSPLTCAGATAENCMRIVRSRSNQRTITPHSLSFLAFTNLHQQWHRYARSQLGHSVFGAVARHPCYPLPPSSPKATFHTSDRSDHRTDHHQITSPNRSSSHQITVQIICPTCATSTFRVQAFGKKNAGAKTTTARVHTADRSHDNHRRVHVAHGSAPAADMPELHDT